jgi:methylmalonic aciduria homocystinuria type C protein
VGAPFVLPYDADTLAVLIISTPDMFDLAFKPFICRQDCVGPRDPIDNCVAHYFSQIKQVGG